MTKAKKEFIDSLWMHTEYGQWLFAVASENQNKADELAEKMNSYPRSIEAIDKELSKKIAEHLENWNEFDEYLKMLDDENYNLVEFMIAVDAFGKVYDILKR